MKKHPVTVRVARWSATHPWLAMVAWLVFVLVSLIGGSASGLQQVTTEDLAIGESGRASVMMEEADFDDRPTENVLITSSAGALDGVKARAAADRLTDLMRGRPEVAEVKPAIPSGDGQALLIQVTMKAEADEAQDQIPAVLEQTDAVQREHPDLRLEQVGQASLQKALGDTLGKDFQKAELISLPVTLAILIIVFGALIAAGVPVLLALSAVMASIGLNSLVSHVLPSSGVASTIILLIGLAVGVDYSLFYLRREREERARGRGHVDAVEIAAATSGRAVVTSGLAVIVSMAGLYLAGDAQFAAMGTAAIIVVAVAVLGSVTVLPALLAKLGRWVDRPRVPVLWRLTVRQRPPRIWPALLRPALRAPLPTLLVSVGVLVLLALPALGMKLKVPGMEDLPRNIPVMQAFDRMAAAFPSTGTAHQVVVQAPAGRAEQVRAALADLDRRTGGNPLFAQDQATPPRTSPDGSVTVMTVATPYTMRSDEAKESLEQLRDTFVPETVGRVDGAQYAVGGLLASSEDFGDRVVTKLPLVIGFVLAMTFLIMALTFRSVAIAACSIGLNLLSIGAAYGVLVLVFQGTWAEGLLGFESTGSVVAWLPLFLFVVLFGLSMDYHVFVVSRIREAVLDGRPNREAVAYGIVSSAGVVTSAATIMIAVFAIFATLSTIDMKQLGVGLAVAILIDATIIRLVVLPSAMALLGPANWWAPRFLRGKDEPPASVAENITRPAEKVPTAL